MRKFIRILCMLLAVMFVFSACGGANNKNNNDDGNSSDEKVANENPGIKLDASELLLKKGTTKDLSVNFVPKYQGDSTDVTLTSSNEAVATVSGKTVTAVASGYAAITVKGGDYSATCYVTVVGEKTEFTLEYNNKTEVKDTTADPLATVSHSFGNGYIAGKVVKVTMPEGFKYLGVTIGSGVKETIVYVPGGVYEYTVPSDLSTILPSGFAVSSKISVRIPSATELATTRNVALNPYDSNKSGVTDVNAYPHVTCNNEYNKNEFGARCAIDGFTQNTGHGWYPNQSWGPNSTVNMTDYLTIDFERSVLVSEIVIYLRGDFGHDGYFSTIVAEFSDGTSQIIKPKEVRNGQTITFEAKETTFVKLTGFTCTGAQWTGLAEVEVMGIEKI